jgi:hypothetical protein
MVFMVLHVLWENEVVIIDLHGAYNLMHIREGDEVVIVVYTLAWLRWSNNLDMKGKKY